MVGADATQLRTALNAWQNRVHREWASELVEAVRPEAPISTPTPTSTRPPGELRRSIRVKRVSPGFGSSRSVLEAPVIQAATTEKGARRHPIAASRAPLLRFWWPRGPRGPRIYYFRSVNHPGNDPEPWWEPGLRRHAKPTLRRAARRVRF